MAVKKSYSPMFEKKWFEVATFCVHRNQTVTDVNCSTFNVLKSCKIFQQHSMIHTQQM